MHVQDASTQKFAFRAADLLATPPHKPCRTEDCGVSIGGHIPPGVLACTTAGPPAFNSPFHLKTVRKKNSASPLILSLSLPLSIPISSAVFCFALAAVAPGLATARLPSQIAYSRTRQRHRNIRATRRRTSSMHCLTATIRQHQQQHNDRNSGHPQQNNILFYFGPQGCMHAFRPPVTVSRPVWRQSATHSFHSFSGI